MNHHQDFPMFIYIYMLACSLVYMLPTLFQKRLYRRRLDKIRNFAKFNILSIVTDIILKTQSFKSCRGLSGEVYNHPRHYLKG